MESKLIGRKIVEARKKLYLSQAQLAEQLFISPQAVGKWERGESFPDILTFMKLAKALQVDLNYFSDEFESIGIPEPSVRINLSASAINRKLNWNMSSSNWIDADFSGLSQLNEKFSSSNMKSCKFIGSDLSGLMLKSNNVEKCDFSKSNFSQSKLLNSNIGFSSFAGSSLIETAFSGCNIGNCNFSNADLSYATFKRCSFLKNKIEEAIFNHTSFIEMSFDDMVFEGTIENCSFENCDFYTVKFENARIKNTFFNGRKLKKIQFVNCQMDRITYEFLKNGKANLSGITIIQS